MVPFESKFVCLRHIVNNDVKEFKMGVALSSPRSGSHGLAIIIITIIVRKKDTHVKKLAYNRPRVLWTAESRVHS